MSWELPTRAVIGGESYGIHADFRDVLEVFSYLDDPALPEYLRWRIALALFYEGQIPECCAREAMDYLAWFLNCGREETPTPGPKLIDWKQDEQVVAADINKVAGREVRALPFLHWWTFMAYFHAIGEGQLSTLVSIREKLLRGKRLEKWEQEYYRKNKALVDLKQRLSPEEQAEKQRLERLLNAKC